jgi:hypothetical protein
MGNAPRVTGGVDRVISVSLSEADWQAFLASTPQPVSWIQQRIQEAIAAARRAQAEPTSLSAAASDAVNRTSATTR